MSTIDDDDTVSVDAPFPRIVAVEARGALHVLVTWSDGGQVVVDLAPTILTFRTYAPLRDDRALFESVHVVNPSVIAWGGDDAIDTHVLQIERLAEDVMDGASFRSFLEETGLTWDAAAAQLGLGRRTIAYYAKAARIPRHIGLACAHLRETGFKKALY